jgi:hypothetical protein
MLLNKWLQFALSVLGGLSALASAIDWSVIGNAKLSATVATVVFAIKGITNMLAPGRNTVATPTGGTVVTHQ